MPEFTSRIPEDAEKTRMLDQPVNLRSLLEDYERRLIVEALLAAGGNQRRAAASLGILATTLCEKMKRLGLRRRPAADAEDAFSMSESA